ASLFNWVYIIKSKLFCKIQISELEIKKHLKPILILFAMLVSIDLYTLLDTTMLGFIKGDYSVGIYTAAIKIPRLVNSVIASVGAVLVPRLSYYFDLDRDRFHTLVDKAHDFIIFITVPAFVGIMMMANEIVLVFAGNQYEDAFLTTRLLAPLTLVIPVSVLFNNQIFIPMRKEILVLKSTCVGAVVNLIFNSILIPYFAENGAAIASVAAEFSVMLVCVYHVKKELKTLVVWGKYLRALCSSVSIVVLCLAAEYMIENAYVRFGAAVMASTIAYCLLNIKTIKGFMSLKQGE
ncbi:MAG: polysaccharide biosynthesis C-terminal domain-containing protein, partial [Lachnospiraceae bacterium]|nr:polysaccharide biosynthesis C-terminal domain-containing protein [Lachnospiraceae bacterium]